MVQVICKCTYVLMVITVVIPWINLILPHDYHIGSWRKHNWAKLEVARLGT